MTWRLSAPSAEPIFSTKPSGSHSSSTLTRVRSASRVSKVTVPALRGLSVLTQAILRSGVCSVIWAKYSRRTPATSTRNRSDVSSICSTESMPFMNSGKVSNCVHWLYAVDTGTSTSMLSSTLATGCSPSDGGRAPAAARPYGAADSKLSARLCRDKRLLRVLTAAGRKLAARSLPLPPVRREAPGVVSVPGGRPPGPFGKGSHGRELRGGVDRLD